jgi:hypothetical protein
VRNSTWPPYAGAVQPDTGGRFEVLLLSQDANGARFRVELSTNAGVWSNEALVSQASGEVEWGAWVTAADSVTPPEWLSKYLRAGLRAAWRAHSEDGWPRRLTRWRDAPDPRRARDVDENR